MVEADAARPSQRKALTLWASLITLAACTPLVGSSSPPNADSAIADAVITDAVIADAVITDVAPTDASSADAALDSPACTFDASGTPGARDRTYPGGTFAAPNDFVRFRGALLDRRGRVLLYGSSPRCGVGTSADFVFVRHGADGLLDRTFGTNGVACIANPHSPARDDIVYACTVDASTGSIYAVGSSADRTRHIGVALRVTDSGRLDETFGDGGLVELPTSLGTARASYYPVALALFGGAIIIAGGSDERFGFLARVDLHGAVDTDFDNTDAAYDTSVLGWHALGTSGAYAYTAGIDALDGSVVVRRIGSDGAFDAKYGAHGSAHALAGAAARASALAALDDGRVVVAAAAGITDVNTSRATLVRFTAAGALDTSFGSGGTYIASTLLNPDYEFSVLATTCNGGLILASREARAGTVATLPRLDRLDSRGRLDRTFASAPGVVGDESTHGPLAALVDPSTQAIYLASRSGFDTSYAIVRVLP